MALARLYRARLPSPEDLLDPGHGRPRDDRGPGKDGRPSRGDDAGAGSGSRKSRIRENMAEGSVWFRAAIGRKKNAEARWLLPMICRRGGIGKNDIGAINILETATEFEVSQRVAESFAIRIKGPDKDDNIRIEALEGEPQRPVPSEKRSYQPSKETLAGTPGDRCCRGIRASHLARSEARSDPARLGAKTHRDFDFGRREFQKSASRRPKGRKGTAVPNPKPVTSKKKCRKLNQQIRTACSLSSSTDGQATGPARKLQLTHGDEGHRMACKSRYVRSIEPRASQARPMAD